MPTRDTSAKRSRQRANDEWITDEAARRLMRYVTIDEMAAALSNSLGPVRFLWRDGWKRRVRRWNRADAEQHRAPCPHTGVPCTGSGS